MARSTKTATTAVPKAATTAPTKPPSPSGTAHEPEHCTFTSA